MKQITTQQDPIDEMLENAIGQEEYQKSKERINKMTDKELFQELDRMAGSLQGKIKFAKTGRMRRENFS